MAEQIDHAVTAAGLSDRFGEPTARAVGKVQPEVDEWTAAFIAKSPFCVVSTAAADGSVDASPKGGDPGFVTVADPKTVLIPDYSGNKLFFGMKNILENPHVGLLFLIPGENWTLRVGGKAQIVDDPATLALIDRSDAKSQKPQLAIKVDVQEVFLHCPKSFTYADLWNPEKHDRFEEFPPYLRQPAATPEPALVPRGEPKR